MATKKEAGAGRGFVNPKPVNVSEEDYVTPKQRMEMEQAVADRKAGAAAEAAYNKATGMRKGGYVRAADGCCTKGKTRGKMV
jgi:hypothetical protein